jgi:hypothetical protein
MPKAFDEKKDGQQLTIGKEGVTISNQSIKK